MKSKCIPFGAAFLPYLLDGSQTMTHRLMLPQPENRETAEWMARSCSYGKPGDIVYVPQRWRKTQDGYELWQPGDDTAGWNPARLMPQEAARLRLRLKEVTPVRLAEIPEENALCEGMERRQVSYTGWIYRNYTDKQSPTTSALRSLQSYLCSLYGPTVWQESPWVFAIRFERADSPRNSTQSSSDIEFLLPI